MSVQQIKNFFGKIFSQLSISFKLLKFSLDKEMFFFHERDKLIEIIKNTMEIDDFLISIFALSGLVLALIEVISI